MDILDISPLGSLSCSVLFKTGLCAFYGEDIHVEECFDDQVQ